MDLYENFPEFAYDSELFAGATPAPLEATVTIAAASAETTYKRGTILGLNAAGKMIPFGSDVSGGNVTAKANMILANDTVVGTSDVVAVAYKAGYFNRNKLIVSGGYTMKAEDEEELRKCGIFLADAIID